MGRGPLQQGAGWEEDGGSAGLEDKWEKRGLVGEAVGVSLHPLGRARAVGGGDPGGEGWQAVWLKLLSYRKAKSVLQSNRRVTSGPQMLKIRGSQKIFISFMD